MYDILQLNDMLVPELLDIAEDLKIDNAKKLDKQGLIYKILDKQAVMNSQQKAGSSDERPKRKRIVKASTANTTEEAVVEEPIAEPKRQIKKSAPAKKEEKPKKGRKKTEDHPVEAESSENTEPQLELPIAEEEAQVAEVPQP